MADSNITKSALASALKELMETTPFAKITVSDICAKCNMNRKSFYYHFRDKFDLVNWIFDVEYLNHVQIGKNLIGWNSVLHLCNYFYENKDFYRKAMKVEDQNSFINHFRDLVSPLMAEDIREIVGEQSLRIRHAAVKPVEMSTKQPSVHALHRNTVLFRLILCMMQKLSETLSLRRPV